MSDRCAEALDAEGKAKAELLAKLQSLEPNAEEEALGRVLPEQDRPERGPLEIYRLQEEIRSALMEACEEVGLKNMQEDDTRDKAALWEQAKQNVQVGAIVREWASGFNSDDELVRLAETYAEKVMETIHETMSPSSGQDEDEVVLRLSPDADNEGSAVIL